MGTKNNPGQFDCYANADPDEPMFVLLARDRHAPDLVRLWALVRHRAGEDEDKISEALECADSMREWLIKHGKRETDLGEVLIEATKGMDEHPEGYNGSCMCDLCLSYGT